MDLDGLRALLLVVETGSFNQAAGRLDVSRTTLTRRLARLEAEFGCPLLVTSRDGAEPTVSGTRLAEGARELLSQAAELETSIRLGLDNPGRHVRIWVSPGFHPDLLAMGLAQLRQRLPSLQFEIQVRAAPFRGGADDQPDLFACFGRPQLGPYVVFQAVNLPIALKATPDYIRVHGRPTSLEDLADHELWAWDKALINTENGLALMTNKGKQQIVKPVMVLNDLHQIHLMVQSGCCIGLVPNGPFNAFQPEEEELLAGQLGGTTGLWVAVPEITSHAPWMRLLMDEIRSMFINFAAVDGGAEVDMAWKPMSGR